MIVAKRFGRLSQGRPRLTCLEYVRPWEIGVEPVVVKGYRVTV